MANTLAFAAVEYEIVDFQDLGTLGSTGGTNPWSINELGHVVGSGFDSEGAMHGFIWADGQIDAVPGMFFANDINEEGDIVGEHLGPLYTPPPEYMPPFIPFHPQLAALFRNGALISLGSLDADDAYGSGFISAINNDGAMVGYADAGKVFDNQPFADNEPVRAVISTGGGLAVLSGFGDTGVANDINDAGQIVGWRREGDSSAPRRACLREPGGSTIDVSPDGVFSSEAVAINENGDLIGNANAQVFLRRAGGASEFLPNSLGAEIVSASGLNDQAWAVGTYIRDRVLDRADRPFFHDGTQMLDLNALAAQFLAADNQVGIYRLTRATAINNAGQIVGYGKYRAPDGDDYWERGFIMTIRRKPPALIVHDVVDSGPAEARLEGVTVRLTLGAELFAEMVTDASGRAEFPAGLDLDAVYNVEMHKVVTVPGHPSITVGRTYAALKPSEVADDQVRLQFPETLRRSLEIQLRKIENPTFPSQLSSTALITPYQTTAIRNLLADWGDLDPETLQLHAERDEALVRLLAGTESLALFLDSMSTLSAETAALIGKTLTSLIGLVQSQGDLLKQIEKQLAEEVAKQALLEQAKLIAYAVLLAGGEQVAKAAADTFSTALKNLVPATAADMVNEALNITAKGIVSALASKKWETSKGLEGGRKKLLEDAAQKIIGEVGGRIFLSSYVVNTQDDLNLAAIRTRTFDGDGTAQEGRSAAINFTNYKIVNEVDYVLDSMRTLAQTAEQFEVVADISEVAGNLTKMKAVSIAAQVIKAMNLGMVTTASVEGVAMRETVSNDYAPQGLELAFRPFSGGGGSGAAFTPGKRPTLSSGSPITTGYASALAALATALTGGDATAIQNAATALLAEEAALEALCTALSERLALLAAQSSPPPFGVVEALEALGNARTAVHIERGILYPWIAGVIVPLLADPEVDTADILAQIAVLQNTLPALDAAADGANAATTGLTAPAAVVLLAHGLQSGSFSAENGNLQIQARLHNPGDAPMTNLEVALIPGAATGPVSPLRLVSPATQMVPELAAGQTLTLLWEVVATDVSPEGTGSQADYGIEIASGGSTLLTVEGAFNVRSGGPLFATWITGKLPDTLALGFAEDADGDRVSNGLERFLAGMPGAGDAPGLVIDSDGSGIVLRHKRSAERGIDTTPHYEWSPDLSTWLASGATSGAVSVTLPPVVLSGEGAQDQLIEIRPQVTGTAPRLFYRLRLEQDVTEPPSPGPITAPAIVTEPSAFVSVNEGEPLTLTVVATGTKPLLHQWSLNGVDIPGGSGPTYSVTAATFSNAGLYRVRITGPGGVLESPPYEVNVGGFSGGGGGD